MEKILVMEEKKEKNLNEIAKPFVYILPKVNDEHLGKKKILIPKTMKQLLSNANKLFLFPTPILSILHEDKTLVTKIEELVPKETVLASTMDPEFEIKMIDEPAQESPAQMSPPGKSQKGIIDLNDPVQPITFGPFNSLTTQFISPPPSPKAPSNKDEIKSSKRNLETELPTSTRTSTQKIRLPTAAAVALGAGSPKKSTQKFALGVASPTNPTKKIDMRRLSRPPSGSSSDEEDDVRPGSSLSKGSAFLQRADSDDDDDDDSPEAQRKRKQQEEARLREQSLVAGQEFMTLLADIIPPADIPQQSVQSSLDGLPGDRHEFLNLISDWEAEQLYMWLHNASDQPFLERFPIQPYHDPVIMRISDYFGQHRAVVNGQSTYTFKSGIVGPRKSGKTTMLAHLVDQYLVELAGTGLWKDTFAFVIDIKQIVPLFVNHVKLYKTMLYLVLDAISKQKPTIQPEIAQIRRQMRSVTEKRSPLITKHSYPELNIIAKHLNDSFNDEYSIDQWYTNIFYLPISIAKAVGFKNVSVFADNLEFGDIYVKPSAPFLKDNHNIFLIEHIKCLLAHTNFVVGCQTDSRLYEVLSPIDEAGIDGWAGVDFISTTDIFTDFGSRLHCYYLVEIQEEPEPVQLYVEMCGGVVPYISIWDELNMAIFRINRADPDSDEWNESYYDAVSKAQELVDVLFVSPETKKITVCGVKRLSKLRSELIAEQDEQNKLNQQFLNEGVEEEDDISRTVAE